MITQEKKMELRQKVKDTFQPVQSQSNRRGYQGRLVIDPDMLQDVLEEIIDMIPDIA